MKTFIAFVAAVVLISIVFVLVSIVNASPKASFTVEVTAESVLPDYMLQLTPTAAATETVHQVPIGQILVGNIDFCAAAYKTATVLNILQIVSLVKDAQFNFMAHPELGMDLEKARSRVNIQKMIDVSYMRCKTVPMLVNVLLTATPQP